MFHVTDCFDAAYLLNAKMNRYFVDASAHANHVIVVGSGIGGSTVAAMLAQSGLKVTVIDAVAAHKGHIAAALTPVISSDDNPRSRLSRLGARLADRYWRDLQADTGVRFGSACGALQLQRPDGSKRAQDLKAQAEVFAQPHWARWVERDQASELAAIELPRGGIWYPGGWLIQVPELIGLLQATPGVQMMFREVNSIERVGQGWLVKDAKGNPLAQGDAVVLANAGDVTGLLKRSGFEQAVSACSRLAALHRLAGEITLLPADRLRGGPSCIVGGDGYVLPAIDGWCVSGGTYVRGAQRAECTEMGIRTNIDRAGQLLGLSPEIDRYQNLPGWAGWRAVLPGRLPAIGQIPSLPKLWVFTANASRGLTWSVLGAMLIRDALTDQKISIGELDQQMLSVIEP